MNELTAARLRELLDYDPETGVFTWLVHVRKARPGAVAGTLMCHSRRSIRVCGRNYLEHRLAWLYMTGEWPSDQIDHINGDPSDNRWCNLREATNIQNHGNLRAHRDNKSGVKGVSWDDRRRKWAVCLMADGKKVYRARFDSKAKATAAYYLASRKYFGDFAKPLGVADLIEPGPQSLGNDWLGI